MYIVLQASDEGEEHPFVFTITKDELQKELDSQLKNEGIIHEYLKDWPKDGLRGRQRLVLKYEAITPIIVEVITKVRVS
jgi:hypothetical protein